MKIIQKPFFNQFKGQITLRVPRIFLTEFKIPLIWSKKFPKGIKNTPHGIQLWPQMENYRKILKKFDQIIEIFYFFPFQQLFLQIRYCFHHFFILKFINFDFFEFQEKKSSKCYK